MATNYYDPYFDDNPAPAAQAATTSGFGSGGGIPFNPAWLNNAGPILGAFGDIFGGKSERKAAEKRYQTAQGQIGNYNQQTAQYLQMLQQALGENPNLFGPQTTTQTSSTESDQTTMPKLAPEYGKIGGMLKKTYEQKLARGSSLPPGYGTRAAAAIEANYAPLEQNAKNEAARRNISADTFMLGNPATRAKAGAQADLAASLPLLEEDRFKTNVLDPAQNFTAQFGLGSRSRGTSNTSGTQISPASIAAILQYYGLLKPEAPIILT